MSVNIPVQERNATFGASLSEPHTSVTALHMHACIYLSIYLCLFGPTTYCKFQISTFKYFTIIELHPSATL